MSIKNVTVTAWSFSRLSTYDTCPAKFGYQAKGMKEPPSPALEKGQAVHKLGEDYLRGKLRTVPKEYDNFKKEMVRMRKLEYVPEEMWCLDKEWEEAPGYGEPGHWDHVWLRVKVDAYGFPEDDLMEVVDFKTGKVNEEQHMEQLKLYAAAALSLWEIERVSVKLWYLDIGHEKEETFTAMDRDELVKFWNQRAAKLFKDKRFSPNPSYLCKWCAFSKSKGGPCKY